MANVILFRNIAPNTNLSFKVVTLTGDERMIDVEPSDKILALKEKLEEKEGIPPQQQRLVFQGKQLKDDKTINNYKLKAGTVLHLVVALRGGEDNNITYSEDDF